MRKIKYKFISHQIDKGTEEKPIMEKVLKEKIRNDTEDEWEAAKMEAVGEIIPFDDGQPETYQPTESERLDAVEAAILDLLGVQL